MPSVIVTIPAHNEAATIEQVIEGVKAVMRGATIQVVCNACSDNTAVLAERCGATVFDTTMCGLANAFRMEMAQALSCGAEVIIHIDADGQYEPEEIPLLMEWIDKGYDLVLGNRLCKKLKKKKSLSKYILNRVGALGYSILFGHWIPDMTTGFRAFTPAVARLPIVSDYTYTQEQTWRAIKGGFKIKSVPITFYPRQSGESRLISSVASYLIRSAKDLRRFAL